jgi:hypothetical protein
MEKKLDRVCHALHDDQENIEPNLAHVKVRSGSRIIQEQKVKHFFQD